MCRPQKVLWEGEATAVNIFTMPNAVKNPREGESLR